MKLIVGAVVVVAMFVFFADRGSALISDLRSQFTGIKNQVTELLPGSDAYALGVQEGVKIRSDVNYVDQFNIALLPGASQLIESVKSGQITQSVVGDIANLYWPVAALKAGIIDLSAENRAEFVRGMVEGYFGNQTEETTPLQ